MIRNLYKRKRKKKKGKTNSLSFESAKDVLSESSIDSTTKVEQWMRYNDQVNESMSNDSSYLEEEMYKQKHIKDDKLYKHYKNYVYVKAAFSKLVDMKI